MAEIVSSLCAVDGIISVKVSHSCVSVGQYHTTVGMRVFDIVVEGIALPNVDLVQLGGGVAFKALTLDFFTDVADGFLSINLLFNDPMIDNPSKFIAAA